MARLGKRTIRVNAEGDKSHFMQLDFILNVSQDGLFTTTLDEKDVAIIKSYGIKLDTNGRRNGRQGFFSDKTAEGLSKKISDVLKQCLSREMISEEIVIRYSIRSTASFGFDMDGDIIPNMAYSENCKPNLDLYWQNGTEFTSAANKQPVGLQFFAMPYWKRVYKYRNGVEKTDYIEIRDYGKSEGGELDPNKYHLRWLSGIKSTKPTGEIHEISYTEERAKFFVNLFKSICKMAHMIAKFEKPEAILDLISSGRTLMSPKD